MNFRLKSENKTDYTMISNEFIDKYIKGVNHAFVMVYIVLLRYFYSHNDIDVTLISDITGLLKSDIVKAVQFWSEKGVLKLEKKDDGSVELELVDLNKKKMLEEAKKQAALEIKKEFPEKKIIKSSENRASYTNEEINRISEKNSDIKFILKKASEAYGKLLTSNERNVLVSLVDWLQMPIEVIAVLITYCSERTNSIYYLEKKAIDWYEKGIDTEEKAAGIIKLYNNEYKEIMRFFGMGGIEPDEELQNYMTKWVKVYKMPMEFIKDACSRTVSAIGKTGKPAFAYADSILTRWFEKGVETAEDIKKIDDEFSRQKKQKNENRQQTSHGQENVKSNVNTSKNRFVNYEQRNINPDKMREIERKILENDLKKLGGS